MTSAPPSKPTLDYATPPPSKGINVVLAATIAYVLGAWVCAGIFEIIVYIAARGFAQWRFVFEAPIDVPMEMIRYPSLFTFAILGCVLMASLVIYRILRRTFPRKAGN